MVVIQFDGEPAHEQQWLMGGVDYDCDEEGGFRPVDPATGALGAALPSAPEGWIHPRDAGLELVGGHWLRKGEVGL